MAKEKLFTPEDFDKPKDKSFWHRYKRYIIAIAVLLIIVAIVLCFILCGRADQKERVRDAQDQIEILSSKKQSIVSPETERVEKDIALDSQDIVNIESETFSDEESKNFEVKQEVTTPESTVHPNKVSGNIEQEARSVIHGDYGNFPERREKLGGRYQEIQNRVNQLKKEGFF